MVTSIFRTFRSNRTDSALRYDESDRLESLLAIACDGSSEDCYDDPPGEIPPLNPSPGGGRRSDPETQGRGPRPTENVATRLAETLFGALTPAPAAV